MTDLKALTVKQPWAAAIINDGKNVENRSRPTNHRGRLFIHAGLGWDKNAVKFIHGLTRKVYMQSWHGMVIGWVDVIDCHHADDCYDGVEQCSPWAMADHYHWVLADPVPIKPIPAKGRLGIWKLGTTE